MDTKERRFGKMYKNSLHLTAFWLAALSLGLAGCQTQGQKQYNARATAVYEAVAARKLCDEKISQKLKEPKYKNGKNGYLSDQDIRDIQHNRTLNSACKKEYVQNVSKTSVDYALAIIEFHSKVDSIALSAFKKEITIGQMFERLGKAQQENYQNLSRIEVALDQRDESMHQNELQRRRQAALIGAQIMYNQQQQIQAYNSNYTPQITTCNWVGNFLQCTTH